MLGATVVVLVLAAAGCGGGGVDEADATSTTVEPSTTSEPVPPSTAPTEEAAVLAAVDGYWRTYFEANDPPDPNYAGLASYSEGQALGITRENAARRRTLRQAVRRSTSTLFERSTALVALHGDEAEVKDCVVDGSQLVDVPSGVVLNDAVNTVRFRFSLDRIGGQWKVVESVVVESLPDHASCG